MMAGRNRDRVQRKSVPFFIVFNMLTGCFLSTALGSNWYVEPSSQGSANGASWSNAWSMSNLNSNWSSVQPGDTVWLAGGTYRTPIQPTTNGTSANPITVNRVQATDTVPASSPGWNASFDSQVIIDSNGPGAEYASRNIGNYFVFNGRVQNGMRFYCGPNAGTVSSGLPTGAINFDYGSGGQKCITFTNCDIAGPCPVGDTTYVQPYFSAPISIWTWNGTNYGGASNLLFDHCDIHGGVVAVTCVNWTNSTIQYCRIFDILDYSGVEHSNLMQLNGSGNITIRYNDIHDWQVEGFFFLSAAPSSAPNWWIYGNTFHDCSNSVGRFMETQTGGSTGTIYVWNNTLYNIPLAVFSSASQGTYSSSSQCYNNIFWDCGGVFNNFQGTADYNMYGGGTPSFSETHGINGGSTSPCVQISGNTYPYSPGTANYALTSATGSTSARANGTNLSADFTTDRKGTVFGSNNSNGAWDIGAYSYVANPAATRTPAPTPTPASTLNPTPPAPTDLRITGSPEAARFSN